MSEHADGLDSTTAAIVHDFRVFAEDRVLQANNYDVTMYFDTSDVQPALLGMREYITTENPEDHPSSIKIAPRYYQPRALVSALLACGRLGKFSMLAPHQAELGSRISRWVDFRHHDTEKEDVLRESFLDAVTKRTSRRTLASLKSPREREEYVLEHVGNAESLFRAFHSVSHTWWERLQELQKRKLLAIEPAGVSFRKLAGHEKFKEVEDFFLGIKGQTWRGGQTLVSKNCFADAMVFFLLMHLAKSGGDRGTIVPRFFDSQGSFRDAARAVGLEEELTISKPPSKQTCSALVGPWYFLAKVAFPTFVRAMRYNVVTQDAIRDLFQALEKIPGGPAVPVSEIASLKFARAKPLRGAMQDVLELSFFEQVWLRQQAKADLKEFAKRMRSTSEMIRRKNFVTTFATIVERSTSELQESAREYTRLSTIWQDLRKGILPLSRRIHLAMEAHNGYLDPIRDLDLIRFCLDDGTKAAVVEFVQAIRECGDEPFQITAQRAWRELIERYYLADRDDSSAILTVAILWAMGLHDLIVAILAPALRKDSVVLNVFCAAAHFTMGRKSPVPESILVGLVRCFKDIENTCARERSFLEEAALASHIGYVAFHCATMGGLESELASRSASTREDARSHLECAIAYARMSGRLLREGGKGAASDENTAVLEAYVTNQQLYYLLIRGRVEDREEMDRLFERMGSFEVNQRDVVWQWQYDDTLSRFHEFFADLTGDEELKKKQLHLALGRIEKACSFVPTEGAYIERERLVIRQRAHVIGKLSALSIPSAGRAAQGGGADMDIREQYDA